MFSGYSWEAFSEGKGKRSGPGGDGKCGGGGGGGGNERDVRKGIYGLDILKTKKI